MEDRPKIIPDFKGIISKDKNEKRIKMLSGKINCRLTIESHVVKKLLKDAMWHNNACIIIVEMIYIYILGTGVVT